MKAIDLSSAAPTLTEILELAGNENVIVRTPEGREFVVAEIDDFEKEVAATGAIRDSPSSFPNAPRKRPDSAWKR